MLSLWCSNV
jgi:hypothetical protein